MKATKQTLRRRRIIKEADHLWMQLCFEEWGRMCNYCGKPAMQVHHFYRKSMYGHLRYDIDNGVPCCQGCHLRADDSNYIDILKDRRGEDWYLSLKEKSFHPPKNYKNNIIWIKGELERLKK